MNAAVQMNHITKKFGKLYANRDVSLTVERNSIHGIVGENGAGKTTLMKILYGMHPADSGEIILFGEKVAFHSPKDAIEKRVGMIHQHFTLVPSMTVADNVVLGRPPIRFGVLDKERAWTEVEALCRRCNFQMDLKARVEDLPVGLKQRVEILKALYLGADVLIMDEPTAVLTPQEITGLFETLEKIRNDGTSIILITHKLSEVMDLTDHITVLRAGQVSGNVLTKDTNEVELARMMVGRDVFLQIEKEEQRPGDAVLELEHISCKNAEGVKVLKDVSLTVRRGEIVGIAGVQGNGQTELEDAIAGMDTMYAGSISINGKKVRNVGGGQFPDDVVPAAETGKMGVFFPESGPGAAGEPGGAVRHKNSRGQSGGLIPVRRQHAEADRGPGVQLKAPDSGGFPAHPRRGHRSHGVYSPEAGGAAGRRVRRASDLQRAVGDFVPQRPDYGDVRGEDRGRDDLRPGGYHPAGTVDGGNHAGGRRKCGIGGS